MASGYDIVGLVLGVLGMTAVIQLCYSYVQSRLPLQRIRTLDDDLHETDTLFHMAVRDGLISDRTVLHELEDRLLKISGCAEALRVMAYTATTFPTQFRAYMGGLSRDIDNLHLEVTVVRANVVSKSEVGRKKLEIQGQFPRRPSLNPLINHSIRSQSTLSSLLVPRTSAYMSSSLRPDANATGFSRHAPSVSGAQIRHRDTASLSALPSPSASQGSSQNPSQPVDLEVLREMVDTMNQNLLTLIALLRAQQSAGAPVEEHPLATVVEQSQEMATALTEHVNNAHKASPPPVQEVATSSTLPTQNVSAEVATTDDTIPATEASLI